MSSDLISYVSIGSHRIQRNDEYRILTIDNKMIKFTRTEYQLLLPLLTREAVSETELSKMLYACEEGPQTSQAIAKHLRNIRSKLQTAGLTVGRIKSYDYFLQGETS